MNQRRSSHDRFQVGQRGESDLYGGRGRSPQRGYEGIEFGEERGGRHPSSSRGGSFRPSQGRQDYENYDRSRSRSPSYRGGATGRGFEDERYGRYNEDERLGEASRGYQGYQGRYQGGRQGGRDYHEERFPQRGGPSYHEDESYGSGRSSRRGVSGQRGYDYEQEASRNFRDTRRSGSFRNQDDDYYGEDDMTSHGRDRKSVV